MPKITRHGGPSVPPVEGADTEDSEAPSPAAPEPSEKPGRPRVRTAATRSKKSRTE